MACCRVIRVSKLFILFLLIFFPHSTTEFWVENIRKDKTGNSFTLDIFRNSSLKLAEFMFNIKWKFRDLVTRYV